MELQRWSRTDLGSDSRWFTALPAAWWRDLVPCEHVHLSVRASGTFKAVGYRRGGGRIVIDEVDGDLELLGLSLRGYDWIAIEAPESSELESVRWSVEVEVDLPGIIAVVPTFRREDDATHQAGTFLASDLIRRVIVIDQGGTLGEHEPFARLLAVNPERLKLVKQRNLGGSGGYSRGMIESLADPDCAVLLSDDDAALPEESLRRMLTAQALAARGGRKLVLATPMLSAEEPDQLISAAEWVDYRSFRWGAADGLRAPISVEGQTEGLVETLGVNHTPNYAGWWGALLPPGTVDEVGLPAPFFLKWDDAEHGLRAAAKGYEFMALPGTGVWHPTWGAHKTLTTWVAVLLHRNRLATASAYGAGRGVIRDSLVHQVKHVLSLQYDVAELWAAGIDQFLAGPEWLGTDLGEARANAQGVVDSLLPTTPTGEIPTNVLRIGPAQRFLRSVTGLLPRRGNLAAACAASDFTWRDGIGMDRVVLTDENGAALSELVRDDARARSMLAGAVHQHWTLTRRWKSIAPLYADALKKHTTPEYWYEVLGIRP